MKNLFGLVALGLIAGLVSPLFAGDPEEKADKLQEKLLKRIHKTAEPVDGFTSVEMFKAMEDGEIEVSFVPKDSSQANVIVENKSDKPLAIKMPEAFAAVPVLKQAGFGGGGNFGGGGGNFGGGGQFGTGGGNQGVGGGFGGGGFGGGGFGGGGFGGGGFGGGGGGFGGGAGGPGGVFNIPPGLKGKLKVNTVCLEHGKKDPAPRMKYQIVPISDFTDNEEVVETLKLMASGRIPQLTAQAAAWNQMDGLSWQEMLVLDRIRLSNGYFERYFHPGHVKVAQEVVAFAKHQVEEQGESGDRSFGDQQSVGETEGDGQ